MAKVNKRRKKVISYGEKAALKVIPQMKYSGLKTRVPLLLLGKKSILISMLKHGVFPRKMKRLIYS